MDVGRAALPTCLLATLVACGPDPNQTGEELYAQHCAECHGSDGRGDSLQVNLSPALDLTRSEMVRKGANGLVYRRIAQGYGAMPGFSHILDYEELQRVTEFTVQISPLD